jgi:hypothetical protein
MPEKPFCRPLRSLPDAMGHRSIFKWRGKANHSAGF